MAFSVVIDRGPISAEYTRFRDLPREQWPKLVKARSGFLARSVPHDCRCLVSFIA
jgi:hypothetical protein